jgi:Domain of unknown function (DUF6471)
MGVSYDTYLSLVKGGSVVYDPFVFGATLMGLAKTEAELAERGSRFLKAELKRANVTYAELAKRLKRHGLTGETEDSIKAKLKRGTFAATFLFACLAALGLEGMQLDDL